MRTERIKSKRSKRSGNTYKLNSFEQAMKRIMRRRRGMRTERSKSRRSKRSGNT